MNHLRPCVLVLLAACGAEPPTPAVVSAPMQGMKDADDDRVAYATLEGFVLVPTEGVKWPTLEAAGDGRATPSEDVTAHRVVADHGDAVEVLPIVHNDHHHCYHGTYATGGTLSVPGFVMKRDLALVLAHTVIVRGEGGTSYEARAGVRVQAEGGRRWAIAEGLRLELPDSAKLSLAYTSVERFSNPPHWRGHGGPEPTFVLPEATVRVGEHAFSGPTIAAHPALEIAQDVRGEGDSRTITVQAGCVSIRGTVAATALRQGYEAGAGMGAIGRGGLGGLGPVPPPPKEHYVPAKTVLFWEGSDLAAGELVSAMRTYPADAPICMDLDQGFVGDPEVCVAASTVKRDCREACRREGLCAESADEGRCIAATAEHCRASSQCEEHGACSLRGEACVAKDDADCAASFACEDEPHACMAYEGRCVVTPNPDCENRPACKNEGRCVANELGACVSSDAGCAASIACARAGNCATYGGGCAPEDDVHCRRSVLCADEGKCAVEDHACVVQSSRDCRASAACKKRGACALLTTERGGGLLGGAREVRYCGPANNSDCSRATGCEGFGSCSVDKRWGGERSCRFTN